MPLTLPYVFLLIAAGALLVPGRLRRISVVGLVPLGLAVAALTVRAGDGLADLAVRAAERSISLGFLRLNSALGILGATLVLVGAVGSLARARREPLGWLALFLLAGGVAPLLAAHLPLLSYIGWLPVLGAALAIAAGSIFIFLLGRASRIAKLVERLDRAVLERNPPELLPAGSTTVDFTWVIGFFASAVIIVITPSLRALVLATVVAGTVGHVLMRRLGGGSPIPVTALFSLFIIPVYQMLRTVAGDPATVIADLGNIPLSEAAGIRIVPWIGLTAWGLAGLWPLHGISFPLLGPLSGIVLIRLGANPMAGAMQHWSPVFIPLALLGLGHGVAAPGGESFRPRRLIEVLVALALLGIFAGGDGLIGAGWLLGGAALVPWVFYPLRDLTRRYGLARVFWLPLVWGGLLVITGGLTSQVSYTVLAAAGIAAGLWVYHSPE
jgi:hypothetical protein